MIHTDAHTDSITQLPDNLRGSTPAFIAEAFQRVIAGNFSDVFPVDQLEHFFQVYTSAPTPTTNLRIYLNNFHAYFPGGYRREIVEEQTEGSLRQRVDPAYLSVHSDKRLDETGAQFIADVDLAIAACHLSPPDFHHELATAEKEAFYRKTRPVYIALRKMGYSHEDLVL